MLVPDLIFLLPWTRIIAGGLGISDWDSTTYLFLSLLRLLQLVRGQGAWSAPGVPHLCSIAL